MVNVCVINQPFDGSPMRSQSFNIVAWNDLMYQIVIADQYFDIGIDQNHNPILFLIPTYTNLLCRNNSDTNKYILGN